MSEAHQPVPGLTVQRLRPNICWDFLVSTGMEPKNRSHEWQNSVARGAYKESFENYREKVSVVQALSSGSNPDRVRLDTAVLAMETAREQYQVCRDALVREMVGSAVPSEAADGLPSDEKVREVAGLLWELEGKPQGSELNDWYRAEAIIRRAAQCAAGC